MRTLILITLIILSLWAVMPTHAQDNAKPLSACMGLDSFYVYDETTYSFLDVNTDALQRLEGVQVAWLGYAPRDTTNYWELERKGEEYGFKGINFDYLGQSYIYYFYDMRTGWTERWTFTEYGSQYFVTETTLDKFARNDGTAYDYHITGNPAGGACMWLIDANKLDWIEDTP